MACGKDTTKKNEPVFGSSPDGDDCGADGSPDQEGVRARRLMDKFSGHSPRVGMGHRLGHLQHPVGGNHAVWPLEDSGDRDALHPVNRRRRRRGGPSAPPPGTVVAMSGPVPAEEWK